MLAPKAGPEIHFKNFLGVPGSALCDLRDLPEPFATLQPERVTCQRCLAILGRVRSHDLGIPSPKQRDAE